MLFKLGDITMTGGHLIKCLEEDDSTMTIMHAFVQCLKHDDVEKQRSRQRKIIFPPENLVSFLKQTYFGIVATGSHKGDIL
jgi:hypothetical protein